jgi:UDP-N-acetylglucosamine acyltransferase
MSIHAKSIVAEGVRLGSKVTVGPYAVIEPDTVIGDSSEIRAHVVIKRFTSLGPGNIVHEGAVLGGEPQDLAFVECRSYLRIGSNNRIGEGATIHRGTRPDSATIVGSNCFIMGNAHIAHNCRLGDAAIIANNVALAGYVDVADHAFISGGVVIHQFCRVGRLSMIGGNSKIVQDCLPFIVTDGVPGRACGLNMVGLRRAGLKSGEVQLLKNAYRILLRSGLPLDVALEQLATIGSTLVDELINFVRSSKRGFCHEANKNRTP